MTDAQAAIWKEAVRLNKEGSERERILAYAHLCETLGDQALDDALDNAVRIHDPTECSSSMSGTGSQPPRLSALVQEVPMTHSLDDALVEKVALVERLRHRAVARLSLRRPTRADRYDAELDNSAADRIAALEAAGVAELREALTEAHAAIVASNCYIALVQAYVEATEQFLLTQDGAICGLSGGSDDPGRGAKKAWDKFVSARIAIGKHEAAALTNQGKAQG